MSTRLHLIIRTEFLYFMYNKENKPNLSNYVMIRICRITVFTVTLIKTGSLFLTFLEILEN